MEHPAAELADCGCSQGGGFPSPIPGLQTRRVTPHKNDFRIFIRRNLIVSSQRTAPTQPCFPG